MKNVTSVCLSAAFLMSAASLSADTVFLDFGGTAGSFYDADTDNYWNTVGTSASSTSSLVTSTNAASGITYTLDSAFSGVNSGGVSSPDTNLLGDLAVGSATADYGYVQGYIGFSGSASITLSGLDTNATYTFSFFGSRSNDQLRETLYQVIGSSTKSVSLTTSGTGISNDGTANYNDDEIGLIANITPDVNGEIVINVGRGSFGDFGYLNACRVTSTIPEPGTYAMFAGFAGLAMIGLRRRR